MSRVSGFLEKECCQDAEIEQALSTEVVRIEVKEERAGQSAN